jgi:hypothetical protein
LQDAVAPDRVHERRGQTRLVAADVDDARLYQPYGCRSLGVELFDVVRVGAHAIGGRQPFAHRTFDGFVRETGFDFRHGGPLGDEETTRTAELFYLP